MKFSQQREIDKKAKAATEALNEHVQDVARQLFRDQEEWLDGCMKDLMPPDIYQMAKHDDCHDKVSDYIKRHKIKITFIPDSVRIRIDVAGKPYAEFVPKFQFDDGEPIEITPKMVSESGLN